MDHFKALPGEVVLLLLFVSLFAGVCKNYRTHLIEVEAEHMGQGEKHLILVGIWTKGKIQELFITFFNNLGRFSPFPRENEGDWYLWFLVILCGFK